MTLREIADSKNITEELRSRGTLLETVKSELSKVTDERQEEEIQNVLKIANRVVKFTPDYEMPDFDQGDLAASVLELTFNLEKVGGVPFTNAAAYLLNMGNYERMLSISLEGNRKFPDNVEILNKATIAAEGLGDSEAINMIKEKKEKLFDKDPNALAGELGIMINNWKQEEAKNLVNSYASKAKKMVPKIYSNLFFIYNQGIKDEHTEQMAAKALELINSGTDGYDTDPELAYHASLYFVLSGSWQNAEIVINKYRGSGSPMTQSIIYESLSTAIISKDIERVKMALDEFLKYYNKDNTFFTGYPYAYANASNCYAMLGNKEKTIEFLKIAKNNAMDISYVKGMDDYKFIIQEKEFTELFN